MAIGLSRSFSEAKMNEPIEESQTFLWEYHGFYCDGCLREDAWTFFLRPTVARSQGRLLKAQIQKPTRKVHNVRQAEQTIQALAIAEAFRCICRALGGRRSLYGRVHPRFFML
jgi:hypothetical protein